MKKRSEGFLAEDKIPHDSEVFDYIRERNDILWEFVRAEIPGASGHLDSYLPAALQLMRNRTSRTVHEGEAE